MQSAIEELYAAFHSPKPATIDGCPHCIEKKEVGTLLSKALPGLTSDELGPYASSVFLTVGDDADFRYFLPRIFEISAHDRGWYPTPEIVLGKLKLAKSADWSKRQRDAVAAFVEVWFEQALTADDPDHADEVLCGIGRSGLDLKPFLNRLFETPTVLKLIFELNSHDLYMSNRLTNPFWRDVPESEQIVVDFLRSPEVELKIAEA